MTKKLISAVLLVICVFCGLWLALLAVCEDVLFTKFGLAMGSAILFCAAILCAGYGQSKKEHEEQEKESPHE